MCSDSHCHLLHLSEKTGHLPLILKAMQDEQFPCVMDIGTEPGDLAKRSAVLTAVYGSVSAIPPCIHFSAGIWPSREHIQHQEEALRLLENDIRSLIHAGQPYAAVGECGIDRYWNTGNAEEMEQERSLFKKQLALARRYNMAVIVHSRDAYRETCACIDEIGWHRGVIHCFSYDVTAAEAFVSRGWYISLPGTITSMRTAEQRKQLKALLTCIPRDRLLLETDSPYLAPYPVQKESNTPLGIAYTYNTAASVINCTVEELCTTVYQNCCRLFSVHPVYTEKSPM